MIIRVKKIYRNIIYAFLLGFSILLIGVSISFIVYKLMPGDPVIGYLVASGNPMFTQEEYEAMEKLLGLDLHIIIQFFRYLGDFFIGNWKISFLSGSKATVLVIPTIFRMVGLFILPLIIGLGTGIWLGKFTYRYRDRWVDKLIQILCVPVISIPVFFFGSVFQFFFSYKWGIFNPIGDNLMPMYIMTLLTFALIT